MKGAIRTIWLTRPDLRALCGNDPAEFEYWLILHGRREYKGLAESDFTAHREAAASGLTRLQDHVWNSRPDLQALFDIGTAEGRQGFIWWYFIHGIVELDLIGFVTEAQRNFLAEPDPGIVQDASLPITRLMMEVWRRDPALQERYRLYTQPGRVSFPSWFIAEGGVAMGFGALFEELAGPPLITAPAMSAPRTELPFGVNLIGYIRGEFGIGEDARMAVRSLDAAGIPVSLHNIEPGPGISQRDSGLEDRFSMALPYAINLFCMTGADLACLAAKDGNALFEGRRNIGFWPWELPRWPAEWQHAFDLVDEVWASSRYTYNAFAESCPKPVRHLPMAVMTDETDGLGRRDFGLPEDRFLFVFSFDTVSSVTRKNPLACLRAFRRAFPVGTEPVGLVVKAMRAPPDAPEWREVREEAGADPRISLIETTLKRSAVLDLYRACDCFLSLHRAEGFGRGIAEAMMLGKPVIVTGYSGNLDFTTPGAAALVGYRPRSLVEGDYPSGEGQVWAEPDVEHAAWWMRRIAADRDLRERLSRQGRMTVSETYAPGTVGREYTARLGALLPER